MLLTGCYAGNFRQSVIFNDPLDVTPRKRGRYEHFLLFLHDRQDIILLACKQREQNKEAAATALS
jgi:hypothetical protein